MSAVPSNPKQLLRVLTVDVPNLLQYTKTGQFNEFDVMYEVFARVISITEGMPSEKFILLRTVDTKPVIRAFYYTHEPLTFRVDDIVRCLGTVSRHNRRFQAISIRTIDYAEHQRLINRLEVVTNFSIANMLK